MVTVPSSTDKIGFWFGKIWEDHETHFSLFVVLAQGSLRTWHIHTTQHRTVSNISIIFLHRFYYVFLQLCTFADIIIALCEQLTSCITPMQQLLSNANNEQQTTNPIQCDWLHCICICFCFLVRAVPYSKSY